MPDQSKVAISVPSEDPKKKKKPEEEEKDDKKPGSSTQKDGKGTGSKDDKEGDGDELVIYPSILWSSLTEPLQSEEDLQLKGELEMLAERLKVSISSEAITYCVFLNKVPRKATKTCTDQH